MNNLEPEIIWKVVSAQRSASLSYRVANRADSSIYVFDRLWSYAREALADDWCYVEISSRSATISRQLWPLPAGMMHENPEVPYGRLIEPQRVVDGEFSVPLPLEVTHPYANRRKGQAGFSEATITTLEFRLGWAPVEELPRETPVVLNSESLFLFPYYTLAAKQRIATAASLSVELTGLTPR